MASESDEEMLIMVDLHGIIESDWDSHIGNKCKIVGIDTDEPLLQLDHYIFRGKYADIPGTALLFDDVSHENVDENGDICDGATNQIYKYRYHTHKKLIMQRAFLKEKEAENITESKDTTGDSSEQLQKLDDKNAADNSTAETSCSAENSEKQTSDVSSNKQDTLPLQTDESCVETMDSVSDSQKTFESARSSNVECSPESS